MFQSYFALISLTENVRYTNALKEQIAEPEFGNTKAQIRLNPLQYVCVSNLVDSLSLCDEFTGKKRHGAEKAINMLFGI